MLSHYCFGSSKRSHSTSRQSRYPLLFFHPFAKSTHVSLNLCNSPRQVETYPTATSTCKWAMAASVCSTAALHPGRPCRSSTGQPASGGKNTEVGQVLMDAVICPVIRFAIPSLLLTACKTCVATRLIMASELITVKRVYAVASSTILIMLI